MIPKNHSKGSLLAIHNGLFKKEWSVRIQEKYEHGNGVLIYLSRYLGSSPVKPEQIKLINHNKEVLFSYWSHRDKKKKTERLTIDVFLKRYLVHQPEPNTHSIRYYGLYSSQAKGKREKCMTLLGKTDHQNESPIKCLINNLNEIVCDCCGAGDFRASWHSETIGLDEKTIIKYLACMYNKEFKRLTLLS